MSAGVSQVGDAVALYLAEQQRIISEFPVEAVTATARALFETYERAGTVYAIANGGNAGTLDHVCCDFRYHPFVCQDDKSRALGPDVRRLRFVNVCASAAELTALANDIGGDSVYAAALAPVLTSGDLLMAYSGSGNSANIVKALEVAVARGARTFAMTKGSGGRCRELADICLVVPGSSRFPGQTGRNDNNFHFEDAMLSVNHMLVGLLKQRITTLASPSCAPDHV